MPLAIIEFEFVPAIVPRAKLLPEAEPVVPAAMVPTVTFVPSLLNPVLIVALFAHMDVIVWELLPVPVRSEELTTVLTPTTLLVQGPPVGQPQAPELLIATDKFSAVSSAFVVLAPE